MNSSDNIFRRFAVVAAVVATFLLFGASGAQAASTQVLAAYAPLAAQEDDPSDEETQDPSDEETEDPDNEEDSEDSDDEDSDDEDSDSEETDEPTDEPTFTEPPPTDPTDDITEMPTEDAGATSEEGPSPLGWVLLAGGVASAAAAFLVYRRNRPL